jgi:hypothetical protein
MNDINHEELSANFVATSALFLNGTKINLFKFFRNEKLFLKFIPICLSNITVTLNLFLATRCTIHIYELHKLTFIKWHPLLKFVTILDFQAYILAST